MATVTENIPKRHGADLKRARRIARPIRWTVCADPEPTPERWQALRAARSAQQG